MNFSVVPRNATAIRQMSKMLLQTASRGSRLVSAQKSCSFCGKCVSLSLALPWSRFYSRAFRDDLSNCKRDGRGHVRLSHQSLKDLRFWRRISQLDGQCLPIKPLIPAAASHTDAAEMGFGGTLHTFDLHPGTPDLWYDQGVCYWRKTTRSMNLRSLGPSADCCWEPSGSTY